MVCAWSARSRERTSARLRRRAVELPRRLAAAGVLAVLCAALGMAPGLTGPAAASCVGPVLTVGDDPSAAAAADPEAAPAPLGRGRQQVSGQWFREGCDDGGGGAGCAGPLTSTEEPMEEVDLVLRQGGASWVLGTADAHGDRYDTSWEFDVPDDVTAGPAVLSAGGVDLPVDVGP